MKLSARRTWQSITTITTIDGGNVITVSGANSSPVFQVNAGGTLTLTKLTITRGYNASGAHCREGAQQLLVLPFGLPAGSDAGFC